MKKQSTDKDVLADMSDNPEDFIKPGKFIDSDDPGIIAFANQVISGAHSNTEKAIKLYYAIRDDIRYDPYISWTEDDSYRASTCLERKRGYCVSKASLLTACARAIGIPARIAFADVRNHLCTPRLRKLMGTDTFTYHGITEFWLNNCWVKATPTFNISLCNRFDVTPLEFDGKSDAMLHSFDQQGRKHMEYLNFHGAFADVPVERIRSAILATYGHDAGVLGDGSDFEKEAKKPDGASITTH